MRTFVLPLACVAHLVYAQRSQTKPYNFGPASENRQRLTMLDMVDLQATRMRASDKFYPLTALARLLGAQHPLAAFKHPYPGFCTGAHCPTGDSNCPTARQHAVPCMASLTETFTSKQKKALRLYVGQLHNKKKLVKLRVAIPASSADHVDAALAKHEIVSLKFFAESKQEAKEMAEEIAELTNAAVCQNIGKTAVLYRPSERNVIPLEQLPTKPKPKIKRGPDGREIDPNEEVTTIALNNLHLDVSEDQIRRDCEAFGPVSQVLVFHRRTDSASTQAAHVAKAFVRFETLGHAMDAMESINYQRVQINGQSDVTAGNCYRNVQQ